MPSIRTLSRHTLATLAIALYAVSTGAGSATAGGGKIDPDGTLDFEFNFRFPPTTGQIEDVKDAIRRAHDVLCDATDGQVRIENVRLTEGGVAERTGDIWLAPQRCRSGVQLLSNGGNLGTRDRYIHLCSNALNGVVIAHELGHHAFGLGEHYDEQRRFGGPCGIGFGFDPGTVDESNHSIMQQSGDTVCVGPGTLAFDPTFPACSFLPRCDTDADCPASDVCTAVLFSELSVPSNHDPVIGNGVECPEHTATSTLFVTARLDPMAMATTFDASSFDTANATSEIAFDMAVLDARGRILSVPFHKAPECGDADAPQCLGECDPDMVCAVVDGMAGEDECACVGKSEHRVRLFFQKEAMQLWMLHVGIDEEALEGGEEGKLRILASIELMFDGAGDLVATDPANPGFPIADLANQADDLTVALDLTSSTPPSCGTPLDGTMSPTTGVREIAFNGGSAVLSPTFADGRPACNECAQENPRVVEGSLFDCPQRWNTATGRYEVADQSLLHPRPEPGPGESVGLSDWETIEQNLGDLWDLDIVVPAGLPNPTPPPICASTRNVLFDEDVEGTDDVFLVIDRSGSMDRKFDKKDDNSDTRLEFAQAAARAFVDLQFGRGVQIGLISFARQPLTDRPLTALNVAGDAGDLKTAISNLMADGKTAIGEALASAASEFARFALVCTAGRTGDPCSQDSDCNTISGLSDGVCEENNRSRTVFLLSDGKSNRGQSPRRAAEDLQEQGVRIFTVPVGKSADRKLMGRLAGESGGLMFDAEFEDELPPIYAELAAAYQGEGLVLERTASAVQEFLPGPFGDVSAPTGAVLPESESFPFPVEGGADALNVFLSSRNPVVETWNPRFRLLDPDGNVVIEDGDAGVLGDPFYRVLRIPAPPAGTWALEVSGRGIFAQRSFLLASTENDGPDCLAGVHPSVAVPGEGVVITAGASFAAPLEEVAFTGSVLRPDGSRIPLDLVEDPITGTVQASFDDFSVQGIYEVTVTCDVAEGAALRPGEPIFEGPPVIEGVDVPRFLRFARSGFLVEDSALPPCACPEPDCDDDGLSNDFEGNADSDGNGLPDRCDEDSDGDEIPDEVEGNVDTDGDGTPDFRDGDSDGDGILDIDEGALDPDGDGVPNFRDLDSNGNGIPDAEDAFPFDLSPPCDVNGDGAIDQRDIDLIAAARGDAATGPSDPRDADGDGVLTVFDMRICANQCDNVDCELDPVGGTAPLPSCGLLGIEAMLPLLVAAAGRARRQRSKEK